MSRPSVFEHHIQQKIIWTLAHHETAKFSDLRPKGVESNVFTYHLKQLIKAGHIEKLPNSTYQLSFSGKALGVNSDLSLNEWLIQAHSITLMALETEEGLLLRKRLAQPMFGYYGLIHGEPRMGEPVEEGAKYWFKRRTGLEADFTVRGFGLFSIFGENNKFESFTNAVILSSKSIVSGELETTFESGENVWTKDINKIPKDKMFQNMPGILDKLKSTKVGEYFFIQETFKK